MDDRAVVNEVPPTAGWEEVCQGTEYSGYSRTTHSSGQGVISLV